MRNRHREAALAAAAIHSKIRGLPLDCFAALAMTATPDRRTPF
jgi:hypothetical protein